MDIAYAAHTESCTFMLDSDGICRFVAPASARGAYARPAGSPGAQSSAPSPAPSRAACVPDHADRCIGAQYVASIDVAAKGGLIEMPKPGASLLFARIEANGRIALVRSGPLLRFETLSASQSGVRARPDPSSRPSAPAAGAVPPVRVPLVPRASRPTPVMSPPVPMPRARADARPRDSHRAPSVRPDARPVTSRPERRPASTAPVVPRGLDDEEKTTPYHPSHGVIPVQERSPFPSVAAPRPAAGNAAPAKSESARRGILPRLPGAPRVPQIDAPVPASPAPLRPSGPRFRPPAPSAGPTPRRPSIARIAATAPRGSTFETFDDGEDRTLRQHRAR